MVSRQTSTLTIIAGFIAVNVALAIFYAVTPETLVRLRSGIALTYFLSMLTTLAYGAKAFLEDF